MDVLRRLRKKSRQRKTRFLTNSMSFNETPQLSTILICTFIEQCSQPFNCGMQLIEDSLGKKNTIFCEDGFSYLSPDPPDEIEYPKFERIINITTTLEENQTNQTSEENSIPTNTNPHQLSDQNGVSNNHEAIQESNQNNTSNIIESDQHQNESSNTNSPTNESNISEQASDNNSEEKLQALTNELKSIAEKVADISIEKMTLKWGISNQSIPYLIECPELNYSCSEELSPFISILPQILLFIAYEAVLSAESGQCITPNKKCVGAQMSINRQKFEIVQIQKHFSSLIKKISTIDNSKNDGEKTSPSLVLDKLVNYIIKRMIFLFPQVMMTSVPCCSNCFGIYSRASISSPSKSRKTQQRIKMANNPNRLTQSSNLASFKKSEKNRMPTHMRPSTTLNNRQTSLKPQMPSMKPESRFEPFMKTKSGLTVIQNISQKTYMKSIPIYSEMPFTSPKP